MSVIKKVIVIVTERNFDIRDYYRFGIEPLSNNFNVKIFDCCEWLHPEFSAANRQSAIYLSNYLSISSEEHLAESFGQNSDTSIIFDYTFDRRSKKVLRRIAADRKIKILYLVSSRLPEPSDGFLLPQSLRHFLRWMARLILANLSRALTIFEHFTHDHLNSRARVYVVPGSPNCFDPLYYKGHIVRAHSFDYESLYKSPQRQARDEFILYLDSNLDEGHDDEFFGLRRVDKNVATRYFQGLQKLFLLLEKNNGMPVVIAGHPRRKGRDALTLKRLFGERKVIFEQTSNLTSSAALILNSNSASVNFAVLLRKKLIFVYIDPWINDKIVSQVKYWASTLLTPAIDLKVTDKLSKLKIDELSVDQQQYQKYISYYIKCSRNPEKSLWDIIRLELSNYC